MFLAGLNSLRSSYGLDFAESQAGEVFCKFQITAREFEYTSVESFVCALVAGKLSETEVECLVNNVLNAESYFMRHKDQLDYIIESIIPELDSGIADPNAKLKIWHAGCSRGEEAYSMAILIEALTADKSFSRQAQIIGTDVNKRCIERAREGFYNEWSLRNFPPDSRLKHFNIVGKQFRIKDEIKQRVLFKYFNLAQPNGSPPFGPGIQADLILCRNVFIYFTKHHIENALQYFWNLLSPGGYLVLSPTEYLVGIDHPFKLIHYEGGAIFKKTDKDEPETPDYNSRIYESAEFDMDTLDSSENNNIDYSSQYSAREQSNHIDKINKIVTSKNISEKQAIEDAKLLLKEGLYRKALDMLDRFDANYEIDMIRTRAEFKLQSPDFLDKLCESLIKKYPREPGGYFYAALNCHQQGKIDEVLNRLKQVIYLDPEFIAAHLQSAIIYNDLGKIEEYRKSIRAAAKALKKLDGNTEVPFSEGRPAGELMALMEGIETDIR